MARMEIDDVARISDEPVARVGSRFLPVPAALFPPLGDGDAGMVDLPVPVGTPVYAVEAGRVTHAEGSSVGDVVVRGENGTRFHYRRMMPSSVAVSEGEAVDAGTVLGIVASSSSGSSLNFGIQRSDGTWQRAADALVGLPDPSELFLLPPMPGDAGLVSELPSQRRPARAAPTRPAPAARPSPTPAPRPTSVPQPRVVDPTPAPEPTPVQPAAATPEPTPVQPAAVTPEPVEERAPEPAQPAAKLTAADRLTRPRARPGAARTPQPDPPVATEPAAEPPPDTEPVTDRARHSPLREETEPATVVMEPAPAPEPDPDESSSPAADDARVNALVGRRRRPRGDNR